MKFQTGVKNIHMEETMSQIVYLCISFNLIFKKMLTFGHFFKPYIYIKRKKKKKKKGPNQFKLYRLPLTFGHAPVDELEALVRVQPVRLEGDEDAAPCRRDG